MSEIEVNREKVKELEKKLLSQSVITVDDFKFLYAAKLLAEMNHEAAMTKVIWFAFRVGINVGEKNIENKSK